MTLELAQTLDRDDALLPFREQFHIPTSGGQPDLYFVGNSLGLMPRRTESCLQHELEQWKHAGVRGHFEGDFPWVSYHETVTQMMADLVGGMPEEVVTMNTLTVNLHLMMATFFRPSPSRCKILIEDHAFPSDKYAVTSHLRWHGLDARDCLVDVKPEPGEQRIATEKVCQAIRDHRDSLALVMLPGVQYYTGQVFDMPAITRAAHEFDIPVGFDLAHAAGNIELQLHDWDVDFAAWCTYKYLNSGPGSLAGCFIHQRHATNTELPRLAGWWGHDKQSRFLMGNQFVPIPTAEGWQLSNPPIFSLAAIRSSLEVFREAGMMGPLRKKSVAMGQFFRESLSRVLGDRVRVIALPEESGCQLSLEIKLDGVEGKQVFQQLDARGVRTDWREPNVIRAAPVPLYNSFEEIWCFVESLQSCLDSTAG